MNIAACSAFEKPAEEVKIAAPKREFPIDLSEEESKTINKFTADIKR